MRRKGLDKLYDRLAPEERFRLDVEATARGDEEESRRLTEGCPRHSYTLNDIGFSWRWEAARTLGPPIQHRARAKRRLPSLL
jgi:hypothetical protein